MEVIGINRIIITQKYYDGWKAAVANKSKGDIYDEIKSFHRENKPFEEMVIDFSVGVSVSMFYSWKQSPITVEQRGKFWNRRQVYEPGDYFVLGESGERFAVFFSDGESIKSIPTGSINFDQLPDEGKMHLITSLHLMVSAFRHIRDFESDAEVKTEKEYNYKDSKSEKHRDENGTVYISKKTFTISNYRKPTSRKQFTRHTESWEVRGHWRNTPSGGRVWIKPYIKGDIYSPRKEIAYKI